MEITNEQREILLNLLLEKMQSIANCANVDEKKALADYKEKLHALYGVIVDETRVLQDLTKMKTTKAFRCDGAEDYVDTAWCPYCNAENSEDIKLGGTNKFSREFDTDEANAKMFECVCHHCGLMFRVDYFKAV